MICVDDAYLPNHKASELELRSHNLSTFNK